MKSTTVGVFLSIFMYCTLFSSMETAFNENPSSNNKSCSVGFNIYDAPWPLLTKTTDINELRAFIQNIPIHTVDDQGRTLLHWAAIRGLTLLIEVLAEGKADLEAVDNEGCTALHTMARSYTLHLEAFEKLLAHKASVSATNHRLETALHAAALAGNSAYVKALIREGADCNAPCLLKNTPLHRAATENRRVCAQMLIEGGADPDAQNREGETALHEAARWGHAEFLRELVIHPLAINGQNFYQKTALHCASFVDLEHVKTYDAYLECVEILLDAGADHTIADKEGKTALHYAAISGCPKIVELLAARGAKLDVTDAGGRTPFILAKSLKQHACSELLIRLMTPKDSLGVLDRGQIPFVASQLVNTEQSTGPVDPNYSKKNKRIGKKESTDLNASSIAAFKSSTPDHSEISCSSRSESGHPDNATASEPALGKKHTSKQTRAAKPSKLTNKLDAKNSAQSEGPSWSLMIRKSLKKTPVPSAKPVINILHFSDDESTEDGAVQSMNSLDLKTPSLPRGTSATGKAIMETKAANVSVKRDSPLYWIAQQGDREKFKQMLRLSYIEFQPSSEEFNAAQKRLRRSVHSNSDIAVLFIHELVEGKPCNSSLFTDGLLRAHAYLVARLVAFLTTLCADPSLSIEKRNGFQSVDLRNEFAHIIMVGLQKRLKDVQETAT